MRQFPPSLALVLAALVLPAAAEDAGSAATVVELPLLNVVSARRREEAVQEVPAPLSLLDGRLLERQGIYQVQDLPRLLPGLNANFFHARESSLAIRGIGNNTANDGLQGSVGLYLDNVYLGRPGQLAVDLLDLERVELLRGPQGTLFGKNTSAGVLSVNTREPIFANAQQFDLSTGSRNYRQFKAMINALVADGNALRLSAYATHDDGWLKNLRDGEMLNGIDRQGMRLQWLLAGGEGTRVRTIVEHHRDDSSTGTLLPYAYGPLNWGAAAGNLPLGTPGSNATTYGQLAAAFGAGGPVRARPSAYEVSLDGRQRARAWQSAVSVDVTRNLGEHRLTSISAWRDWHFSPDNDTDNTSLAAVTGGFDVDERQFSQEFRLASPKYASHDYLLGGFFLHQDVASRNEFLTGPNALAIASVPNNAVLSGAGRMQINSAALFGQMTRRFGEQFELLAGLRFNHERQRATVTQHAVSPAFPVSPLFMRYDSGPLRALENSLSSQLTVSWRPRDAWLVYLSHARGEKSGGFNLNGALSPGSVLGNAALRVRPERAASFELGLRHASDDGRFSVSGNLFDSRVSDYQAITNTTWNGTYISYLGNVGDLTSRGVELELAYQPADRLDARASLAYTDARFDNGRAPTPAEVFNGSGGTADSGYGKGTRSIAGNRVNGSSRWSAALALHYRFPSTFGEQYVNASYAWRSMAYGDINNSVYSRLPAYGLVNLATGWRFGGRGRHWEISLWARNLLDKRYYLALVGGQNGYFASAGQPRTLGLSVQLAL